MIVTCKICEMPYKANEDDIGICYSCQRKMRGGNHGKERKKSNSGRFAGDTQTDRSRRDSA